jgi:hypothetical protein
MQDEITLVQRIEANAAAACIPLAEGAPARIANAAGGTLSKLRQAHLELALEVEPASFVTVQTRELGS